MTIRKSAWAAITVCGFLSSCASVSVFDLPKIEKDVTVAVQQSEGVISKAQADYHAKKVLLDNLSKVGPPAFRQAEPELRRKLMKMGESLAIMNARRKDMLAAKSEIAAIAYTHSKIASTEPEYERVDNTVKQFETATTAINAAMAGYSQESNALADTVNGKKLYFNFDPVAMQTRIQQNIKIAQTNSSAMQEELNRATDLLNRGANPATRGVQQSLLGEMQRLAQAYNQRAQRFSQISKDIGAQTDNSNVNNLDPSWNQVQKLVSEFENAVKELAQINGKFLKSAADFRHPPKRVH